MRDPDAVWRCRFAWMYGLLALAACTLALWKSVDWHSLLLPIVGVVSLVWVRWIFEAWQETFGRHRPRVRGTGIMPAGFRDLDLLPSEWRRIEGPGARLRSIVLLPLEVARCMVVGILRMFLACGLYALRTAVLWVPLVIGCVIESHAPILLTPYSVLLGCGFLVMCWIFRHAPPEETVSDAVDPVTASAATVRQEPRFAKRQGADMSLGAPPAPEAEVLPGHCLCQQDPGHDGQCSLPRSQAHLPYCASRS